jgi:hypothetical protein
MLRTIGGDIRLTAPLTNITKGDMSHSASSSKRPQRFTVRVIALYVQASVGLMLLIGPICLSYSAEALAASNTDICRAVDPNWTQPEQSAWAQICLYHMADMKGRPLSSDFIKQLLTETPYTELTKHSSVLINDSTINGNLQLSSIEADAGLSITASLISGYVDISDSKFGRSVSFVGSIISKGLLARRTQIDGSLLLGKSERAEPDHHEIISVYNTIRIGQILANGLRLEGSFNLYHARIDGNLDLHQSRIHGDLNIMLTTGHQFLLYESDVTGQLDIVYVQLTPPSRLEDDYSSLLEIFDTRVGKSVSLTGLWYLAQLV